MQLLEEDAEAQDQTAGLNQRLDEWAKRFHFNVNMGKDEIVATKKDTSLNAEYAHLKFPTHLAEVDVLL